MSTEKNKRADIDLLRRIQENLGSLRVLQDEVQDQWVGEDLVYRFWHQSFKVYGLQTYTESILEAFERVAGEDFEIHPWFREILAAGTGVKFEMSHNNAWLEHAKPVVDAFFHAAHLLGMVVKYGEELEEAPSMLPSGWASVLELFQVR